MKKQYSIAMLMVGLVTGAFIQTGAFGYEIDLKELTEKDSASADDVQALPLEEAFEEIENFPTACRGRVIPAFRQWLAKSCEPTKVCDQDLPKMCPKKVCWTGTTWVTRQFTREYKVNRSERYYDYSTTQHHGVSTLTTFTPSTRTEYRTVTTPGSYVRTRCGCEYQPGSTYTQAVDVTSYSTRTEQIPYSYSVTIATPRERHWTETQYETYCKQVPVEKEYCRVVMVPCDSSK